jgi:glycosyltransferase involved in cell wall biosynthesis
LGPVTKGFGLYFDPTKSTSGQRFFDELCRALAEESIPLEERPAVILFNVSGSIKAILAAKLRRQKVLLRIDGLYSDNLSPAFVSRFNWLLRLIFSYGGTGRLKDFLTSWANLIDENYRAFARILLADRIIYQSRFSQVVHARYFPNKPWDVVVNGASYRGNAFKQGSTRPGEIRLITIYDEWKPAKRIDSLVEFVEWARVTKKQPVHLTVLGYTGKVSACGLSGTKSIIENSPFVRTLPRFTIFEGDIRDALLESDIYLTFSYRDPCPNAVVEALAHGLPVVGVASGGIPDIVGEAGVLVPADDFDEGFFSSHRFACSFPPVDFEKILAAVQAVSEDLQNFRAKAENQFRTTLDINEVANRYAAVLRRLAGNAPDPDEIRVEL